MIGEERQESFKVQYQQFDITLRMTAEDVLSIVVDNTLALERYSRDINQEYIMQQDASFQRMFEEAKDIYDYLKAVINEVVIYGHLLVFNYRHRNNRVKRIKFQLIREDIDRVELANLKMEKMQKRFTAQLLQKDIEIQQLKQKYEEMTQILQEIKGEIRAEKEKTRELAEAWRIEFREIKDELQTEKAKNRQLTAILRAKTEKKQAVAHQIELVRVEEGKQIIMQSSEELKVYQKMGHHPNNSHKIFYALTNLTETSARIIRTGGICYYNFINKCEVFPNQKARYSLTINRTASSYIMIGFCTEKGLGNINNYNHAESAYYCCYHSGYLWQSGSYKQIGVGSVGGETVECVAELASCKLSWWKKGSQIAECAVPVGMRNKPILISILLLHTGDKVDLCI